MAYMFLLFYIILLVYIFLCEGRLFQLVADICNTKQFYIINIYSAIIDFYLYLPNKYYKNSLEMFDSYINFRSTYSKFKKYFLLVLFLQIRLRFINQLELEKLFVKQEKNYICHEEIYRNT